MNTRRKFLTALIFLMFITACVIPGLPTTEAAPTFAPTEDTGVVETMVAGTVSAAIELTEQARPTPLPTSTPMPTATPAPQASSTPTATATSAATSAPEMDTFLTVQVDASTVFIDERGGYGLTLPPAWLIMRINGQEYLDMWQLAEAADEDIQHSLLSVQEEDPNVLRLFAIDAQEGHIQNGFVTTMKFNWDEKKPASLESEEKFRSSMLALTGAEVLSAKISTINDSSVGVVEVKRTMKNSADADVTAFQKIAVFNTAKGQMTITLSTVESLKGNLFPVFDAMLSTLKITLK